MNAVLTTEDGGPLVVSVYVIAGTAGAGKTSLALRWAHQVRERFPDGQLYANLRGYDPGEPVAAREALHRLLTSLGVPPGAVPQDLDAAAALYRSLLSDRRVLVVLDNAATVGQVRPLLPGSAHSLVLVTSRSRLSGLAVRDGARRLTLGVLPEPEAVALLRVVTAGYRPVDDERQLAELAQLCARLPLALRIAAERAASHPHLRLADLIADLRDESALWDALSTGDDEEAEAVRTVFSRGPIAPCPSKPPACSACSAYTPDPSSGCGPPPPWQGRPAPVDPGSCWTLWSVLICWSRPPRTVTGFMTFCAPTPSTRPSTRNRQPSGRQLCAACWSGTCTPPMPRRAGSTPPRTACRSRLPWMTSSR
ncbi:hypothetical protein [Streptomyces sp. Mo3]|uniref:hypothetical protein n=1 Tax=Streptomyces sp. Mo3 TaxID=3161190 RepID=UPI0039EE4656